MKLSQRVPLAGALVLLITVAGCVSPEAPTATTASIPGALGASIRDVAALVHTAGDNLSGKAVEGILPASFFIDHEGGEPTLGVTADGVLFYAAITFQNDIAGQPLDALPRTDILAECRRRRVVEDVTPYLPGGVVRTHPDTGDPYVYVDVETGRVFDIDQRFALGCHTVTYSDDQGETWQNVDGKACLTPPADHQTLVTGAPRMLPVSPLYPKIVYYCNNQVASSTCQRSLDGGITFNPMAPAFTGYEGVPEPTLSGLCGGLHGHIVASTDGIVYMPKTHCGVPMVAITEDDGISWTRVKVSDMPSTDDPAMAVDPSGNVYYVFLNPEDWRIYLATSSDQGRTWSAPVDVTPLGMTATNLPTLDAGDDGQLALAYVGTTHPDGYDIDRDDAAAVDNMTWDGYLALISDALSPTPTVTTVRINPADDPLVRGVCGPGRCNNPGLVDFIDVEIDLDGRAWVALVDNCMEACALPGGKASDSTASAGFVGTLAMGPSLRGVNAILPAIHGKVG